MQRGHLSEILMNLLKNSREALGEKGDVLLAITTSGSSPNILKAIETARTRGMRIIILTGELLPSYIPDNYRTIMGAVMILYGTYRLAMLYIKERARRRFDANSD